MHLDNFFEYTIGDTIFHRIHPFTKITLLFLLMSASWLHQIATYVVFILSLIFLIIAGTFRKTNVILFYLRFILILLPLNWYLYSISYPSTKWVLPNFLSLDGFYMALLLTIRILIIIFLLQLLFTTTTPEEIEDFLLSLGAPAYITISFLLTITFIPILMSEAKRIQEAQLLRGLARTNLLKRLTYYLSSLVLPLITSALDRANRIAEVLEIYGVPPENRTTLSELRFTKFDVLIFIVVILTIIGVYYIVLWL